MSPRNRNAILLIWLLLVLPQTILGYGSNGDTWLVARAAQAMWQTGTYVHSRSTGFPLFELAVTPFVHFGGWYLSNFFSVVAGIALLMAFLRLIKHGAFRYPALAFAALALYPAAVKNSSSTIDFIPTLALLMWSYVLLTEGRYAIAAVLIGVACGFRPSSGAFVIPAMIYAYRRGVSWRILVQMAALAIVCGVAAYSPALLRYGLPSRSGLVTLSGRVQLLRGVYFFLQLFGVLQTAAIAGLLAVGLLRVRREDPARLRSAEFAFHVANVALWTGLFALLPEEAEYLLPAFPSVIFLLDYLTARKQMTAITALILSYHVVALNLVGGESGARKLSPSIGPGFTIADIDDRIFKLSTRQAATAYNAAWPTLLMLGETWIPTDNPAWVSTDPQYQMYRQKNGNLYVSSIITDVSELRALRARGFRLVVWKGAKWEYLYSRDQSWRQYVEVVDDLSQFFGTPIRRSQIRS